MIFTKFAVSHFQQVSYICVNYVLLDILKEY